VGDQVWTLSVLGRCELRAPSGASAAPGTRKALALLAYLARQPERRASRERLAAMLWADVDARQAAMNLRKGLSMLRRESDRHGAPPFIERHGDYVRIVPGVLSVDLDAFEQAASEAETDPDQAERAVDLYQGDFLQDFGVRDASEFEIWVLRERQRLRVVAAGLMATALERRLATGVSAEATAQAAMRLVAFDPFEERAHRVLMRLHVRQGRPAAALKHYRDLAAHLERELGVEPEPATLALFNEIRAGRRSPRADAQSTTAADDVEVAAGSVDPDVRARWTPRRWRVAAAAALAVVVALGSIGFMGLSRPPRGPRIESLTRVLSARSNFHRPALSPDGNFLVYSSHLLTPGNEDLYLLALRGGRPVRLTSDPAIDDNAAWSPDGRSIAFVRRSQGGDALCRIYILQMPDGPERLVGKCKAAASSRLAWAANGRALYFSDSPAPGRANVIFQLDLVTGQVRAVTRSPDGYWGDDEPAVSRDGRRLAFLRRETWAASDVHVVDLATGEDRQVTHEGERIWGLAWDRPGRGVLFSSYRARDRGLWWAPLSGGEPRLVSSGLLEFRFLSPARDRDLLAFEVLRDQTFLVDKAAPSAEPVPIRSTVPVSSQSSEWFPAAAADGALAFVSDRSGEEQLWLSVGGVQRPLTGFRNATISEPRWSPDGGRLAFVAARQGGADVYVVDRAGGLLRLTSDDAEDASPVWSPDGRHVYFASRRSGAWRIWRVRADVGGPAEPVTGDGPRSVRLDREGRALFVVLDSRSGVWRIPVKDGRATDPPKMFEPGLQSGDWMNWDVSGSALYFLRRAANGQPGLISRRDLTAGREAVLADASDLFQMASFGVRPTGGLILTRRETETNVMTAELGRGD
jgi:Tol biopolymer transport system component/DNA-binding SARP family transcriptional activator